MLIPYNTDAPIYHLPIATVTIIVINIAIFFATTAGAATIEEFQAHSYLMLESGTVNPLQWVTNNFMHAGYMHLIGNMFFLWAFGLVVEGKIGWLRFTVVYLLVGIIYGAIIQLGMLAFGAEEVVLGASAVIFGLLAMAVVWAPKNDFNCFLLLGIASRPVSLPIMGFGMFYLFFQIVPFFFTGIRMSSGLLHITGLAVGLPIAVVMLRRNWVDCEGWDMFNVWKGNHSKLISERRVDAVEFVKKQKTQKKKKSAATIKAQQESTKLAARALGDAISQGNLAVATAIYQKQLKQDPNFKIPSSQLAAWIQALHQRKRWSESVPLMVRLVSQAPHNTHGARIKLAQILVQVEKKPKQALRVLQGLPRDLQGNLLKQARAVAALAKQQAEQAQ